MQDVPNCPGCGKTGGIPAGSYFGKPAFVANIDGFEVNAGNVVYYNRCLYCGMIWQTSRMEPEQLERWYSEGHYRKWLGQPQLNLDTDEENRSYMTKEWVMMYRLETPPNVNFLDFGCSRGYLLDRMVEEGYTVLGVEENLDYVTTKLPVVQELKEVERAFDIITLIHVLEHIPSPLDFLYFIQEYMMPNGLLFIEIPSTASKGGPFRLAHLTYMEPPVLVALCEKSGLKVMACSISPDGHTRVVCINKAEEQKKNPTGWNNDGVQTFVSPHLTRNYTEEMEQ